MRVGACRNCGTVSWWAYRWHWCEDCWRMFWKAFIPTLATAIAARLVEAWLR